MIEYIGEKEYGGWHTETSGINPESVIYSLGVGENISWDLGIISRFGCDVHAFDMTPRVKEWVALQKLSPKFIFTPVGVSDKDGTEPFEFKDGKVDVSVNARFGDVGRILDLPVKRLSTLMKERGHSHIDVLKMDIEASEYKVIPDILNLDIRQILVESHQRSFVGWRGMKKLYGWLKTRLLLWKMKRAGFKIVEKHEIFPGSSDHDYLFIRRK